jgi:hypothetical protein
MLNHVLQLDSISHWKHVSLYRSGESDVSARWASFPTSWMSCQKFGWLFHWSASERLRWMGKAEMGSEAEMPLYACTDFLCPCRCAKTAIRQVCQDRQRTQMRHLFQCLPKWGWPRRLWWFWKCEPGVTHLDHQRIKIVWSNQKWFDSGRYVATVGSVTNFVRNGHADSHSHFTIINTFVIIDLMNWPRAHL